MKGGAAGLWCAWRAEEGRMGSRSAEVSFHSGSGGAVMAAPEIPLILPLWMLYIHESKQRPEASMGNLSPLRLQTRRMKKVGER